ncbi:MAG TPA: methyltransferase, partial [Bacteroidia bacterium]|nr:methyltransferase [Bacteroidia bacterium]
IIALMLAQRSGAKIDAIDIDRNAFIQATENVMACKWKDRIQVHHISLQKFVGSSNQKYDLIVSNPPYFIDSSKASEESRTNARHTDHLPFDDLLKGVLQLLNPGGKFYIILPIKEGEFFREMAENNKLYLTKATRVFTRADKPEKRLLMRFELIKRMFSEDAIVIEQDERHSYTEAYRELLKEYYVAF